jgi:hypothetical protein
MYDDKVSKQSTTFWKAPADKKTPKAPDRMDKYLDQDGDASNSRKAGGPAPLPKRSA